MVWGLACGGSMTADIGDLVIYMGHVGIVLDRNPKHPNHLEVWFIEMATSIVIYAPLLAKYEKKI
tara:strand:- start:3949 stop:4143 length:195 start_codon:yes stop_codon:yes gene_type:complete